MDDDNKVKRKVGRPCKKKKIVGRPNMGKTQQREEERAQKRAEKAEKKRNVRRKRTKRKKKEQSWSTQDTFSTMGSG